MPIRSDSRCAGSPRRQLDLEWIAARLPTTAWAKVEQELDAIASEAALKINFFECDFLHAMPARGGARLYL